MFILLICYGSAQHLRTTYTVSAPLSPITSFGFLKEGKYEIIFNSTKGNPSLIFIHKNKNSLEVQRELCNDVFSQKSLNNVPFLYSSSTATLKGTVNESGVYYVYGTTCNNSLSSFDIEMIFSNPNSKIDSRNIHLSNYYKYLSIIFFGAFFLWLSHASFLKIFNVPLHTCFMLLPLIKAISLLMYNIYWNVLKITDEPPEWLVILAHVFDLGYYTTYIACIAFLCSGCNVFRTKFSVAEHIDIIVSSTLLTLGVISVPFADTDKKILASLVVLSSGLLWSLNIFVSSMVKMYRLIERIQARKWLLNRVLDARRFILANVTLGIAAIITYVWLYIVGVPDFYCTVAMETAAIAWTTMHMSFYLARWGHKSEVQETQRSTVRAVVLKTPNGVQRVFVGKL